MNMSQQELEISVNPNDSPKSLEEIAEYITEKLSLELEKEMRANDVKYSVFGDVIEIVAGGYQEGIEEEAEDDEDYINLLNQINDENMNNVKGKISNEKFTVFFMPQPCEGESCIVGLRAVIRLNVGLDEVMYWEIDNLVGLIKAVYLL
jgi:sulfatase maturation enzyme AslB (radical SAM superfamily)